jgi:hypothetical protein
MEEFNPVTNVKHQACHVLTGQGSTVMLLNWLGVKKIKVLNSQVIAVKIWLHHYH